MNDLFRDIIATITIQMFVKMSLTSLRLVKLKLFEKLEIWKCQDQHDEWNENTRSVSFERRLSNYICFLYHKRAETFSLRKNSVIGICSLFMLQTIIRVRSKRKNLFRHFLFGRTEKVFHFTKTRNHMPWHGRRKRKPTANNAEARVWINFTFELYV